MILLNDVHLHRIFLSTHFSCPVLFTNIHFGHTM